MNYCIGKMVRNVPQLVIQISTLYFTIENSDGTRSNLLMALLSMLFTIISVLISVFEYALSWKSFRKGVMIKFVFASRTIVKIGRRKFLDKVAHTNAHKIGHSISRTSGLAFIQIERTIPMQLNEGVTFRFIIDADSSKLDHLWQLFVNDVRNGTICDDFAQIYKINKKDNDACVLSQNKLVRLKLNENKHLSVGMPHILS